MRFGHEEPSGLGLSLPKALKALENSRSANISPTVDKALHVEVSTDEGPHAGRVRVAVARKSS